MRLDRVDENSNRTFVGNANSVDEALGMIMGWCHKNHTKVFYIRWSEHQDHFWFDYGSHTCFFELMKKLDKTQVV